MDQTFPWLTTLIVVPFLGALALWFLPKGLRRHARQVEIGGVAAELIIDRGIGQPQTQCAAGNRQQHQTLMQVRVA